MANLNNRRLTILGLHACGWVAQAEPFVSGHGTYLVFVHPRIHDYSMLVGRSGALRKLSANTKKSTSQTDSEQHRALREVGNPAIHWGAPEHAVSAVEAIIANVERKKAAAREAYAAAHPSLARATEKRKVREEAAKAKLRIKRQTNAERAVAAKWKLLLQSAWAKTESPARLEKFRTDWWARQLVMIVAFHEEIQFSNGRRPGVPVQNAH